MPTPEEIAKNLKPDMKDMSDEQLISMADTIGSTDQSQIDALTQEIEDTIDKIWTNAARGEFNDVNKYYCGRDQRDLGKNGVYRSFWTVRVKGKSMKGFRITMDEILE